MSIAKVCSKCGSTDISIEAFVEWDNEEQKFVVRDVCDKGHSCETCGGSCHIEDIELPSTPEEAVAELEDLADSFVTHWHDDDDPGEKKQARHAEARMLAAAELLREEIKMAAALRAQMGAK